jgi:GTP-binding protein
MDGNQNQLRQKMSDTSVSFLKSCTQWEDCPEANKPEFAFIGRSNVGKSSLINLLANHKNLAKTSGKPGKTQTINHFLVDQYWYLVDLPGYGYAKVSKEDRKKFSKQVTDYILNRQNLICLFLLVDSRHEPLKNDLEFMKWLGEKQIPFVIVFTKIDKLSSAELNKKTKVYKTKMLNDWEFLPKTFLSSATAKIGRIEILSYIGNLAVELKGKFNLVN